MCDFITRYHQTHQDTDRVLTLYINPLVIKYSQSSTLPIALLLLLYQPLFNILALRI